MRRRLQEAPHDGWVLDLRACSGGLLPAAVDIGSMFIREGAIVRLAGRDDKEMVLKASGKTVLPLATPLVVLVSNGTSAGGEILAAALQDTGRARVLGARTAGEGTIQTVYPLNDGADTRIALTTHRFLTPKGREIHKVGVQPELTALEPSEGPDPLLKQAERILLADLATEGRGAMPPRFHERR